MRKLGGKGILVAAIVLIGWLVHTHLRETSTAYNFFFPPYDVYQHLASADFDITKAGYEKRLEFSSKYPGNHWVAVLVEKPAEQLGRYGGDFKVRVAIKSGDESITETVAKDSGFWFYGGPEKSGFALATFRIPESGAIGQNLVAVVEVLEPSPSFREKYGKQTIVVEKYSDE